MWQDLVFLAGSVFSLLVLVPTLRDTMAHVPLGTSVPSAAIGTIYGVTFLSLGMSLSAAGSLLTGVAWAVIAVLRSPGPSPSAFGRRWDARLPRSVTGSRSTRENRPNSD